MTMTRLVLPLLITLSASPALAGYTFEIPRFDYPAPTPATQTDTGTLSSQSR